MSFPKEVLEQVNKVRKDPTSYIPLLESKLQYFKGNHYSYPGEITLITNEGAGVVKECIEFLKQQKPLQGLEWNNNMAQAAQDHADDIGPKGISGHNGSNGSTMTSRLEKYGDWMGQIGENISFGEKTAQGVVIQLITDDGVSSRGHRKNIFNSNFKFCGIGSQAHKTYEICTVQDFAEQYTEKGGKMDAPKVGKIDFKQKQPQQQQQQGGSSTVVNTSTSTKVQIKNGKKVTTITKIETMADGSIKETVNTTTEG